MCGNVTSFSPTHTFPLRPKTQQMLLTPKDLDD